MAEGYERNYREANLRLDNGAILTGRKRFGLFREKWACGSVTARNPQALANKVERRASRSRRSYP